MGRHDFNELARLRVKPRTLNEYNNALQVFLDWLPSEQERCSAKRMDMLFNEFAHYIYRRGDGGLSLVSKAKAGLEFYCPEYVGRLTKSTLSLQGWRNVAKVSPHGCCPESAAYVLAHKLIRKGMPDFGVAVLLLFESYIRAIELSRLTPDDILLLPETTETRDHYAVIHIKVGKRDERQNIMIRQYFLAKLLMRWKTRRTIKVGGEGKLLGSSLGVFRDALKEVALKAGLAELNITPHTLRYGGASTDKLHKRLPDSEIQARGRWKLAKTYQHYIQVAELLRQENRMPRKTKDKGDRIVNNPEKYFGVTSNPVKQVLEVAKLS